MGGMTAAAERDALWDAVLASKFDRIERLLLKKRNENENGAPLSERAFHEQTTPPRERAQIVAWPDAVRAVPNCFLRSALFGAIAKGRRRKLEDELVAAVDGIELIFRGAQLDQVDLDLWETVLHAVRMQDLGSECRLTSYALLKTMGKTDTGKNRKTLEAGIVRLVGCAVTLRQGRYKYIGSLISGAATDTVTGQWVISIDPKMRPLFETDQFTQIDWEMRRKLRGQQLAQWLHGFYSSHAKPYPVKVATLLQLAGCSDKSRSSALQTLRKALDSVQSAHTLLDLDERGKAVAACSFTYKIIGDLVHVDRAPSVAQKRHLAKKQLSGRR